MCDARIRSLALTGLVLFAAGCSTGGDTEPASVPEAAQVSRPASPPVVTGIPSPAGPGSLGPGLSAAADGRVFLTWIEPAAPSGHTLRVAAYANGAWSEARSVASGKDWFVTNVDPPAIAVLSDGTLAASWLANHTRGTEAADVHIARSRDQGVTWSAPIVPHRDRSRNQHAFVSLIPGAGGGLHVIWLDGRHTQGDGHGHGQGDMAVMHTTIAADGSLGPETLLDRRACDCCPTSAAVTADGIIAVYRDRSSDEIRDISIVRMSGGQWSQPAPLSRDGWEINACPVNGPAVSADGRNAAVAWFTAANDEPRVHAMLSADAGHTFGAPLRIDEAKPAGRVDIVSLVDGGALVSWIERADQGQDVRIRRIDADGTVHPSMSVSNGVAVASGAAARMERVGNDVVIAWTEAGKPTRVRTSVVTFSTHTAAPAR